MKTSIITTLILTMLVSCQVLKDPKARYIAAEKTFSTTINSINEINKIKPFNKQQKKKIITLADSANKGLEAWNSALSNGTPLNIKTINKTIEAIQELVQLQQIGEQQ